MASVKYLSTSRLEVPPGQIGFGRANRPCNLTGTRFTCETTLESIIQFAYGLDDQSITGPDWITDLRYQIAAVVPPGTSKADTPPMLRRLLSDRFGLKVHWDEKVRPVQALLIAEGGHKLEEAQNPDESSKKTVPLPDASIKSASYRSAGQFFDMAIRMDMLALILSKDLGEPVVNRTGLDKQYRIDSTWKPQPRDGYVLGSAGSDSEFPRALLKQLGLRLEKQRLPRKLLVVDHAERMPTAN